MARSPKKPRTTRKRSSAEDDIPGPARRFAEFLWTIIEEVSLSLPLDWEDTGTRCRRRPGRRPCPGTIHARIETADSPVIQWKCSHCSDSGTITGLKGLGEDLFPDASRTLH